MIMIKEDKGKLLNESAIRANIDKLYYVDKDKCIEETKSFLEFVQNNHTNNERFNKWYCYYTLADCEIVNKNYNIGVKYVSLAKNFASSITEHVKLDWLLAMYYKNFDIPKAVKFYKKCIRLYEEMNEHLNVGKATKNLGELLRDEKIVKEAITIYEKVDCANDDYKKKNVIDAIDRAYKEIIEIILEDRDIQNSELNEIKLQKYILKIHSNDLKREMRDIVRNRVFNYIARLA